MSNRGDYKVRVRMTIEREVIVNADGFDDAEEKALKEAICFLMRTHPHLAFSYETKGYDAEVLWAVEHGSLSDWEKKDD